MNWLECIRNMQFVCFDLYVYLHTTYYRPELHKSLSKNVISILIRYTFHTRLLYTLCFSLLRDWDSPMGLVTVKFEVTHLW